MDLLLLLLLLKMEVPLVVWVEDLKLCSLDEECLWTISLIHESGLKEEEPWSLVLIRRELEEEEEEDESRGMKIECSFGWLESL